MVQRFFGSLPSAVLLLRLATIGLLLSIGDPPTALAVSNSTSDPYLPGTYLVADIYRDWIPPNGSISRQALNPTDGWNFAYVRTSYAAMKSNTTRYNMTEKISKTYGGCCKNFYAGELDDSYAQGLHPRVLRNWLQASNAHTLVFQYRPRRSYTNLVGVFYVEDSGQRGNGILVAMTVNWVQKFLFASSGPTPSGRYRGELGPVTPSDLIELWIDSQGEYSYDWVHFTFSLYTSCAEDDKPTSASLSGSDGLGSSAYFPTASRLIGLGHDDADVVLSSSSQETFWPPGFVKNIGKTFSGGVYDGRGSVWLVPCTADWIIRMNITNPTNVTTRGYKWPSGLGGCFQGGVYDGQNSVWLVPRKGDRVMRVRIHDDDENVTLIAHNEWPPGFDSGGDPSFLGGVYDGQGSIWLVPCSADRVIRINVSDGRMTGFNAWPAAFSKAASAFAGGVYDGHGSIWLVAYNADRMVRLNITDGTMRGYPNWPPNFLKEGLAFFGAVYDGSGGVWLLPNNAACVVRISGFSTNAAADSINMTSYCDWPKGFTKVQHSFAGGFYDAHGSVWLVPHNANHIIRIRTSNGTMTGFGKGDWPVGFEMQDYGFWGGVYDGRGSAWLVPHNADRVIRVSAKNGTRSCAISPSSQVSTTESPIVIEDSGRTCVEVSSSGGDGIGSAPLWTKDRQIVGLGDNLKMEIVPWPNQHFITKSAFKGGAIDGDGQIWLAPANAHFVVRINTTAGGSMTTFEQWPTGFVKPGGAFYGAAYDGHGSVWLAPFTAASIIRINTSTGNLTEYTKWPGYVRSQSSFLGAVYDNRGSVWLVPYAADRVVRIHVHNASMMGYNNWPVGFTMGAAAFFGGVWDSHDSVWMIPHSASNVVRVQLLDQQGDSILMQTYPWPIGFKKRDLAFAGGAFDGRGFIWLAPVDQYELVRIAITNGAMTVYNAWPTGFIKSANAFAGAVFDGFNLWLIPYSATHLVRVDVANGTMKGYNAWPGGKGTHSFVGGVFDGNGSLWLAASDAERVIRVRCAANCPEVEGCHSRRTKTVTSHNSPSATLQNAEEDKSKTHSTTPLVVVAETTLESSNNPAPSNEPTRVPTFAPSSIIFVNTTTTATPQGSTASPRFVQRSKTLSSLGSHGSPNTTLPIQATPTRTEASAAVRQTVTVAASAAFVAAMPTAASSGANSIMDLQSLLIVSQVSCASSALSSAAGGDSTKRILSPIGGNVPYGALFGNVLLVAGFALTHGIVAFVAHKLKPPTDDVVGGLSLVRFPSLSIRVAMFFLPASLFLGSRSLLGAQDADETARRVAANESPIVHILVALGSLAIGAGVVVYLTLTARRCSTEAMLDLPSSMKLEPTSVAPKKDSVEVKQDSAVATQKTHNDGASTLEESLLLEQRRQQIRKPIRYTLYSGLLYCDEDLRWYHRLLLPHGWYKSKVGMVSRYGACFNASKPGFAPGNAMIMGVRLMIQGVVAAVDFNTLAPTLCWLQFSIYGMISLVAAVSIAWQKPLRVPVANLTTCVSQSAIALISFAAAAKLSTESLLPLYVLSSLLVALGSVTGLVAMALERFKWRRAAEKQLGQSSEVNAALLIPRSLDCAGETTVQAADEQKDESLRMVVANPLTKG